MSRKVIITCAVTGAIHTPSMSKALPVTPQEIADAAVDAAEAGAAIVHLHARNPKTGQPDQSPEAFAPFLKIIKQRSNCVINLTTGGAPTMKVDERVRPAAVYKPEVASLNMGSMNFGFFGMLNRFDKFVWSVLGAGRNQLPIAAMAAAMGGNIRVGLEDSLWAAPGRMAASNAEQVQLARKIIEGLGLQVASSDEAREILDLKGGDKLEV